MTGIIRRNRAKQTLSLDDRLRRAAEDARRRAGEVAGETRDALLSKAREFEMQIEINQKLRRHPLLKQ
jgi:hypothetical protein